MARQLKYRDRLREERRRHFIRGVFFVVALLVVLTSGIVYLLFFAHLFDVRSLVIMSDNPASELKEAIILETNQWLDGKTYYIPRRADILFINTSQLKSQLRQHFPKIDSVSISRHFPHGLKIEIRERLPEGIWCMRISQQCFYFNREGIIYENSPQTSGFLILAVQDESEKGVQLGDRIADSSWLSAITDAHRKLTEKNFQIKSIVIPKNSIGDFYVLTSSNLKILLSVDTDVNAQIDAMVGFIAQKMSTDKLSKLQYIDLRVQDRLYYK